MCLILLAHPTRFERVTFAFGGQRTNSSGGLRGRGAKFTVGEKLKKQRVAAPIPCLSH